MITASRKACKILLPHFNPFFGGLGSFFKCVFLSEWASSEAQNSRGGADGCCFGGRAGGREPRVGSTPAARRAQSYKGAAAGGPRGGASRRRLGPRRAGPPGLGAQRGPAGGGAAEAAAEAGGRGGGARDWGGRRQLPP